MSRMSMMHPEDWQERYDAFCERADMAKDERRDRAIDKGADLLAAAKCAANVLFLLEPEVQALGLNAGKVPAMLKAAIAKEEAK